MDVTRQLYDAENSLRDYIDIVFTRQFGEEWATKLDEVKKMEDAWIIKRVPDELSHNQLKGKEKAIQYASIDELRHICSLYWNGDLQATFGDKEILDVYLRILGEFRNADSRRRELFVHQKHLILGIAGDIRSKIIVARNKFETNDEVFPRIESVRDNLGNLWTPGMPRRVKTGASISVAYELEFIITACDPQGADLSYRVHGEKWQSNNVILQKVPASLIGRASLFHLTIKSPRKYHANRMGFDDKVTFEYEVTPQID